MRRSTFLRYASAMLAAALFATSSVVRASGGDDFSENAFMPEYHVPVQDLPGYAAGSLGIVVPSYWRVYHFLAYRALTGHALSKGELAQLGVQGYRVGMAAGANDGASSAENSGVGGWLKARRAVRGAPEAKVDVETDIGDYTYIVNCPADAFDRASKTLGQRVEQGGQQWAAVWLANQDAVFANCSPAIDRRLSPGAPMVRPLTLPPPLPAKAPAWLVRDYAYQRAAAHFYAGRFDEARTGFLAIAQDPASSWHSMGNYLAARALIRSAVAVPAGRAGEDELRNRRDRLGQARSEMAAIAADYAPARGLLSWLDVRVRPEERRRELSAALAVTAVDAATPQMLTDYLFLMDKLEWDAPLGAADPMTSWIGAMQAAGNDRSSKVDDKQAAQRRRAAFDMARVHWDQQHEPMWLMAMLANARGGDVKPAEGRAAAAVKPDSPAFVTLQYHLARLALAEGRVREADATISALLAKPQAISVRNRLLRVKMVTASSAEASFGAAARTLAERDPGVPVPDEGKPQVAGPLFDDDLRAHLELHFPLPMLVRLKPMLAPSQRQAMADFAWTRAVLLGQYALADELTDDLARDRATTRHLYQRFKKAATPDAKRDAALLILANAPELAPHVSGEGDTGAGSYWSCEYRHLGSDGIDSAWPAFVTAGERAEADREMAQLRKVVRRSAYLIPRVLEWARKNKADPEAPKALHFLIASTRNECGGGAKDDTGRHYSKEAFEYLHRQYPKSEWTAQTRYYY